MNMQKKKNAAAVFKDNLIKNCHILFNNTRVAFFLQKSV